MRNTGSLGEFMDFKYPEPCLELNKQPRSLPKIHERDQDGGMYKYKRWKTVLDEYTPSKKIQQHKSQPLKQQRSQDWKADYSLFYRGKKNLSKPFECRVYLLPKTKKLFPNFQREQKKDSLLTELIIESQPSSNKNFNLSKFLEAKRKQRPQNNKKQNILKIQSKSNSQKQNNNFSAFRIMTESSDEKSKVRKLSKERRIELEKSLSWARNRGKDSSYYQLSLKKSEIKKVDSKKSLEKTRKDLLKVVKKSSCYRSFAPLQL